MSLTDPVVTLLHAPIRAFADGIVHPGGEMYALLLLPQITFLATCRFFQSRRGKGRWPALFPMTALRRRSSAIDVMLFVFSNGIPALAGIAAVLMPTRRFVANHLPNVAWGADVFASSRAVTLLSGTIVTLIALDFGSFVSHYLHHKIRVLWAFHAVHHSAPELTPITATRTHPIEYFVNRAIESFVAGALLGVWTAMFQPVLVVQQLLGTHIAYLVCQAAFASVRHSSIPISFGKLERLLVSPRMHQLHHSIDPRHYDRNFGQILSVWDTMFNLRIQKIPQSPIRFGVDGIDGDSFRDALITPFVSAARSLRSPMWSGWSASDVGSTDTDGAATASVVRGALGDSGASLSQMKAQS